jgi:F1F0 ATPase subunit 2
MSEWVPGMLAFATGMALGALHFGGLWHTLRRLPEAGRPLNLLLWSFWVRAALAVTGLGLVMDGRWERLAAALGGFVLMREILVRRLGRNTSG